MAMYERDLENSTEVVLKRASCARSNAAGSRTWKNGARADAARRAAAAGAIRMGRTLGAAITRRREVGPAEAINLFWSSLIFLGLGVLALFVPKAISLPFGVIAVWFAIAGLFQSWRLYARETTPKLLRALKIGARPGLQDGAGTRDMIGVSLDCR